MFFQKFLKYFFISFLKIFKIFLLIYFSKSFQIFFLNYANILLKFSKYFSKFSKYFLEKGYSTQSLATNSVRVHICISLVFPVEVILRHQIFTRQSEDHLLHIFAMISCHHAFLTPGEVIKVKVVENSYFLYGDAKTVPYSVRSL